MKSLPIYIPKAWKRYPFRAEPPCIGHYREYSPWAQLRQFFRRLNIEHQFFNQYKGPKSKLYRRYIDDRVGAPSSTREELNQFITAVNSFRPALKYTWEISDTSLAFLDIKVSVEGNGLCTSVHYKPTDFHNYLLYSSSHPSYAKNSIPYSTLNKITQFWLVEGSTINPKLYSVGVPINFPWKRSVRTIISGKFQLQCYDQ